MTIRNLALALFFILPGMLPAGDTKPDLGHGGKLVTQGGNQFEVVFDNLGLRLFPRDASGRTLALAGVTAEVILETRQGQSSTLALKPDDPASGRPSMLFVKKDFTAVADGALRASFVVKGLPGGAARFSAVLKRSQPVAPPADQLAAMIASYPLTTCVISGETFGAHGAVFDHFHQGQLVRFCCQACVKEFDQDPPRYLQKIAAASEATPAHGGHSP